MNYVEPKQLRTFTPAERTSLKTLGFTQKRVPTNKNIIYFVKKHKILNFYETVEIIDNKISYSYDTNAYYKKPFSIKNIASIKPLTNKVVKAINLLKEIK